MNRAALMIVCLLFCGKIGCAQTNDSTFVPMPVTIFEDNFQSDSAGKFPSHWWIMRPDSAKYKRLCKIHNVKGRKALVIPAMGSDYALLSAPSPRMQGTDYLPSGFTLEYDFLMGKALNMELRFFATHAAVVLDITVNHDQIFSYYVDDGIDDEQNAPLFEPIATSRFSLNEWHHLALSYNANIATCYIDGKKVFNTPGLARNPHKFTLEYNSFDLSYASIVSDTVAYTNFRLATTPNENFNTLLSTKKFVTHAILFDVNKAEIKTESTAFVKQLAGWLKDNPTVKLEIDGHTDNDGEPAANKTLSQKRAEAVKSLLASFGINENRLTAKGYGNTRPIKPNTTPEGKAENRRVEFIKKRTS